MNNSMTVEIYANINLDKYLPHFKHLRLSDKVGPSRMYLLEAVTHDNRILTLVTPHEYQVKNTLDDWMPKPCQ